MYIKPDVGDLVFFHWGRLHDLCVVLGVETSQNYHSGVDYTVELLEPNGTKFMYDVMRNEGHGRHDMHVEMVRIYAPR